MKALLVANDPAVLASLGSILKDSDKFNWVRNYTQSFYILEAVKKNKPNIVFFDIDMSGLHAIEVAEQIKTALPLTDIVFVSAHSEFAVQAFELNALDYILKPVSPDRLTKTLQRIQKRNFVEEDSPSPLMIRCFQSLTFKSTENPLQKINVKWRTNKAKELFILLLHYREKPIRKDMILDLLWPESDWNKGFTRLYTTIYQIRQTLKSINCPIKIKNYEDNYLLDMNGVILDVDEWEKGIKQIPHITAETVRNFQHIIRLYQGDYLAEYDYAWAESERTRLRTLWYKHMMRLSDYFVAHSDYNEAIMTYNRIQELQPYIEESYFMLMKLYDQLSDRNNVILQYEKLTRMLADEFSALPKKEVHHWYVNWMNRVNM